MSTPDPRDQAKALIEANLQQCCKDLVTWNRTGILPEGPVRQAASFLEPRDPHNYIQVTERYVIQAALKAIAEGTQRP